MKLVINKIKHNIRIPFLKKDNNKKANIIISKLLESKFIEDCLDKFTFSSINFKMKTLPNNIEKNIRIKITLNISIINVLY